MKALTLDVPGKMQHTPNFLTPIFGTQVIFNKHVNAIKVFHISNSSRM